MCLWCFIFNFIFICKVNFYKLPYTYVPIYFISNKFTIYKPIIFINYKYSIYSLHYPIYNEPNNKYN